ncbi:unnamed protein product, partial [Laminaria digitata]
SGGGGDGRGFDTERGDSRAPGPLSSAGAAYRPLFSDELAPPPVPVPAPATTAAATTTANSQPGWRGGYRQDRGSTPLRDCDRRVEASRIGVAATRGRGTSGALPVSSKSRLFSRGDDSKSRLFSRGDDWLSAPRTTCDL